MLAGEGAVLIWNDIAPEGRDEFYAWHLGEHMPERVGTPGFRRGRRYIRDDAATAPEFFTLYETDTPQVLVGQDYLQRLNAPTPWTKSATQAFRNTSRALTRVRASFGPGQGGMLATLRFDIADERRAQVERLLAEEVLPRVAALPRVTGAHLCLTDASASGERTAESRDRTDILAAPERAVLVEGCGAADVRAGVDAALAALGDAVRGEPVVGVYRLEYCRLKTPWTAG
ncbi:hypothetical protein GCM10007036_24860 [Alsobacter metallidurans]|uniref:Uncharacterized protein n=1 Tax=Alsobacter metallidurans TaxID=340221 RepID=A0A917I8E9_9HYPH|nr:hypothetical protein [Alsobacter metallidurans]GGH20939.1 hypothetical protein GCM10007036_24860 [Alsobacter metallidurans]